MCAIGQQDKINFSSGAHRACFEAITESQAHKLIQRRIIISGVSKISEILLKFLRHMPCKSVGRKYIWICVSSSNLSSLNLKIAQNKIIKVKHRSEKGAKGMEEGAREWNNTYTWKIRLDYEDLCITTVHNTNKQINYLNMYINVENVHFKNLCDLTREEGELSIPPPPAPPSALNRCLESCAHLESRG